MAMLRRMGLIFERLRGHTLLACHHHAMGEADTSNDVLTNSFGETYTRAD
jgi:hypothetical protein